MPVSEDASAATTRACCARRVRVAARPFAALSALLVSACAVGPNFKTPAPPSIGAYAAHQPSTTAAVPAGARGGAHRAAGEGGLAAGGRRPFPPKRPHEPRSPELP